MPITTVCHLLLGVGQETPFKCCRFQQRRTERPLENVRELFSPWFLFRQPDGERRNFDIDHKVERGTSEGHARIGRKPLPAGKLPLGESLLETVPVESSAIMQRDLTVVVLFDQVNWFAREVFSQKAQEFEDVIAGTRGILKHDEAFGDHFEPIQAIGFGFHKLSLEP